MWLATLFNKIVAGGRTPDVWQTSVTVPVWKGKGDIADCTSYRPIRLLCDTMKVFERVVEARLRKKKIPCTSRASSAFIPLTSAVHTVHGHDNERIPEAASVDYTLCRRCHPCVIVSR
ncbi:hypothetical protein NECAME_01731 [Necator americanus]|uniref:Reverse transcriptase domain-containing protein n=1 Tax=Necator americanus TaxID=51031 RepID=W2TQ64_NECAM|nr:hypothetical protein NECAME_01731 [Necator americanus]ETN83938.1 hypothetical protein NECAME_01731 [Necator americanus]